MKTTRPPSPPTGKSVNGCYASCLNDCGGSLEKEHLIAKCGLLELFGNESFEVAGWVANKTIPLTAKKASSNILCARHNRALAKIDDTFKNWVQCVKIMHGDIKSSMFYRNVNARELALILLQMSCGMLTLHKKPVPQRWVEVLFSMVDYDLKLWQMAKLGDRIPNEIRFHVSILNANGQPVGCVFSAKGFYVATIIDCDAPAEFFPAKEIIVQRENGSIFRTYFK